MACSPNESIRVSKKNLSCRTSVGVQLRITGTHSSEYIPGSAKGLVDHTVTRSLFGSGERPFDQSAVGDATQRGIDRAVCQTLERFDAAGW